MRRICIPIYMCAFLLLFLMLGCGKPIEKNSSDNQEKFYFLKNVAVVDSCHFFTQTAETENSVSTVLVRRDSQQKDMEILSINELADITYTESSFEGSGKKYLYFSVQNETDPETVFMIDSFSWEAQKLFERSSNVAVFENNSKIGWVLTEDSVNAFDLSDGKPKDEFSVPLKEISGNEYFPEGFFGYKGKTQTINIYPLNNALKIEVIRGKEGTQNEYLYYEFNVEKRVILKLNDN